MGFRGQGVMYQALVSHFALLICYNQNLIATKTMFSNKIPWGGRGTLKGSLVYCQGLQPSSYLMKVYNLKIFKTFKTLPRLAAQTSLGEPV